MSRSFAGCTRRLASGDVATVLGQMDQSIEWREAENFIYADRNPYLGPEAILNSVFMRLGTEWESFKVTPEEWLDARRGARYLHRNAVHGYEAICRCGGITPALYSPSRGQDLSKGAGAGNMRCCVRLPRSSPIPNRL